jgi:hypothetical protein
MVKLILLLGVSKTCAPCLCLPETVLDVECIAAWQHAILNFIEIGKSQWHRQNII